MPVTGGKQRSEVLIPRSCSRYRSARRELCVCRPEASRRGQEGRDGSEQRDTAPRFSVGNSDPNRGRVSRGQPMI